ncbi:carboxypeptidase-like regulatory domain-containing protein [Pedobacter sp. NJ-S-72]
MKKLIVLIAILFFTGLAYAQNTYKAIIKDAKTNQSIPGVTVKVQGANITSVSANDGFILLDNIPSGKRLIQFSYIGYKIRTDTLSFPLAQTVPQQIVLESDEKDEELDEIVVSATRSRRTIANIPTRIEVIAGEELDEKGNMKPGEISG